MADKKPEKVDVKKQAKDLITKAPGHTTFENFLAKNSNKILSVLPPSTRKDDRGIIQLTLMRLMVQANETNWKLRNCTMESKLNALLDCARTGLIPFTAMNEAYIIPYGNVATFQFGYRGIIRLCMNTGMYQDIYAKTVNEGDEFKYEYGLHPNLIHRPLDEPIHERVLENKKWIVKELRPITHFYGIYRLTTGGFDFTVCTRQDMEVHRDRYVKTNLKDPDAVWNKDFDQMGLKTIIGKAVKYAPKSEQLAAALRADETIRRELAPMPEDFTPEAQKVFEQRRKMDVEGDKGKQVIDTEAEENEDAKTGDDKTSKLVTEKQLKKYHAMVKDAGLKEKDMDIWVKKYYKVEHKKDLTMVQMDDLYKKLDKKIEAKKIADGFIKHEQEKEKAKNKPLEEQKKEANNVSKEERKKLF